VDFYDFIVTHFRILVRRSGWEETDTLRLSHAAYVDGDRVAYKFVTLGDFDDGYYAVQDHVPGGQDPGLTGVVINDPFAQVAFNFQLVNAGNLASEVVNQRLVATADQAAGVAAGIGGPWGFAVGAALEAFANIWPFFGGADCDGPVAVDQISGSRYIIDTIADDYPTGLVRTQRRYPGLESPDGCGDNSLYEVTWLLHHYRDWTTVTSVTSPIKPLKSAAGVSAAAHNGAVHAFGVVPGVGVTHARSFTGATWNVNEVGSFNIPANLSLPVSAVSFNDRLFVFSVLDDGSVSSLAFTVDGGSWVRQITGPIGLQTAEPIATAVFRNRLYLFARDSATNALRVTSSADLESWDTWTTIPRSGPPPASAVTAVALEDTLYVFGVHQTGQSPQTAVVRNTTHDGNTWTGWDLVEAGARPDIRAAHPLDVAATVFRDRIYIASRWQSEDSAGKNIFYVAVNFSGDGDNWSGWRRPESIAQHQASATPGLAAVGNHLYILAPLIDLSEFPDNTLVVVY